MTDTALRALLVDDEEEEFLLLRYKVAEIRDQEIHLEWVADYDQALAIIQQNLYDVYLLDFNMGHRTGIDLLREAHASGVRAPFILLTGQGSSQVDHAALDAGAIDYLDKQDLKPDLLSRSVRYAIANKRAENELRELYARVSRLEQLKTDMIRMASHDLRTPLMTILSSVRMLESDQLTEEQSRYLNNIDLSVQRMRKIVADILSLERIEQYAQESQQDDVDLRRVAVAAYEEHTESAAEKQIALELNQPDEPLIVRGDEVQLVEALSNLVSNAIKYTPENGRVLVRLFPDAGHAVVRVEDNGYGIPPEQQEKLFLPFSRVKTKETLAIEGTGLGLHLVKNVVDRHNGQLIFFSAYGEGSVFGFALPLVRPR